MNTYTYLIVFFVLGTACLDIAADLINRRHLRMDLPVEFHGVYDPEKYRASLQYQKENSRAETVRNAILTPLTLGFILLGGFDAVDRFARSFGFGSIATGLVFVACVALLRLLVQLPFSIHHTFVTEERYGFNRTSARTFAEDLFKALLLGAILGAPLFAGLQWFFERAGAKAWLISWIVLAVFQLLIAFLAPAILMPLFNKFSPLPDGELKRAIEEYASRERFRLEGIYTMDGSKRSTKSNAFFTGFGSLRRLVLFDTLIEKQSVEELTAVVAHEIGHFKCGHILKSMALSIAVTGIVLFAFSSFIGNPGLFEAFRMERVSVYASLVFIGFLYAPALRLVSIFSLWLSRRAEFEADAYSAKTYGRPEQLVSALKKLSRDNLSDLTPHPLKVWLDYTHPPVLDRIDALRALPGARSAP